MGSVKSLVAVGSVDRGAYLGPLPDVLLPSQFFELVGAQTFSSEQRLMLAGLADAINVLREYRLSPNRRKRNSFNEASSWVFAHGITSPLSFDHVCDALGVDAENLRRRLSQLISEHGGNLLRLRLKEASRMQRPTVNHVRRRSRRVLTSRGGASVGKNAVGAAAGGIANGAERNQSSGASGRNCLELKEETQLANPRIGHDSNNFEP